MTGLFTEIKYIGMPHKNAPWAVGLLQNKTTRLVHVLQAGERKQARAILKSSVLLMRGCCKSPKPKPGPVHH